VTQVVDQVQRVVPPLPAPVQPTVDAVNGVLDDTATAVDGLLGGG
jgi:hypothetical protein